MNTATADDVGKLILRVTLGVLVLFHGVAKLTGGVGGIGDMLEGMGLPAIFAYGVYLGEVVGPLLLIAGFYARIGAGLIFLNMVVAILLVHSNEILALNDHGAWAIELQGMYLFAALGLVLTGPGRFGINAK